MNQSCPGGRGVEPGSLIEEKMLASKAHPKWEDLLTGKIKHHFHLVPAGLMVSKCQRRVSLDSSPQSIKKNIDELYGFFASHENAVSNDLKSIFN